jgi:lipid-A-disaccharide synthase
MGAPGLAFETGEFFYTITVRAAECRPAAALSSAIIVRIHMKPVVLPMSRYDESGRGNRRRRGYMAASIFISAGEASGEHYGALILRALQRQLDERGQTASFFGMGGARMEAAGLQRIVRAEDVAVMGLTEVLHHLPRIWREFQKLKKAIRERRPAVAILIDFPGLHFRLLPIFHRLGIPVVYFVSPQLWAWKKHRIKLVKQYVDRMLVIFPFEEPYYRERGVEAEFVGHPLAETALPSVSREAFAAAHGLDSEKMWIGLLPGSRAKEIREILPEMLRAAVLLFHDYCLEQGNSEPQFILPLAPTLTGEQRRIVAEIIENKRENLTVCTVDDARAVLHHARASVVASGTATLEAALIGNPFVVVYRVSPITYTIAKRIVKVPHVAMANLIAGKRVVPELIQDDFTAENIVQQIEPLLAGSPARQTMLEELARIPALLHTGRAENGAIERVAEVARELMTAR